MSATAAAVLQILVLVAALAVSVPLLGRYLARVYTAERHLRVERVIYQPEHSLRAHLITRR